MEDKRICYVFASRSRPEKFFNCLENIEDNSNSKNYFVWAKLDEDDDTMNNETVKSKLKLYPEVTVKWGLSSGKINAINRDLEDLPDFDIICCHSDDMVFTEFGFDDVIRQNCGADDYLHIPDGHTGNRLCTYAIYGKDYFKRTGYFYNPEYESVYADNEEDERAKKLGRYKFVDVKILRHEHSIWGYGVADELTKKSEHPIVYQKDHQTYLRRKAINFGI